MKRFLVLLLLLGSVGGGYAQTLTPVNSYGFQWQRGKFVVWVQLPEDTASSAPVNSIAGINGVPYIKDFIKWNPINAGAGGSGMDSLLVRNDSLIGLKFSNEFFVAKYDTSKWTYDEYGNYVPKIGYSDTVLLDGKNLVIRNAKLRIPAAVGLDEAVNLAQLQGAIIPARAADNGLSVESDKYVLGQSVDDITGPAEINTNRYIPVGANTIQLNRTPDSYTRLGGVTSRFQHSSSAGTSVTLAEFILRKTSAGPFADASAPVIRFGLQSSDKAIPHALIDIRGERWGTDSTGAFAVYGRSGTFSNPIMRVYSSSNPVNSAPSTLVVGNNFTPASPLFVTGGGQSIYITRESANASMQLTTTHSTNNGTSWYTTMRARGGFNAPTKVEFGDVLGGIRFLGYTGNAEPAASAYMYSAVDGNTTMGVVPLANLLFYTGGAARMRIGSNGNVQVHSRLGVGVDPLAGFSLDVAGAIRARNLGATSTPVRMLVLEADSSIRSADFVATSSGAFTPEITDVAGATDVAAANDMLYTRVGNVITVFGSVEIIVASPGAVSFHMDLPIPDAGGFPFPIFGTVVVGASGVGSVSYLSALQALVSLNTTETGNITVNFSYSYRL